jgi:hypothetical protein
VGYPPPLPFGSGAGPALGPNVFGELAMWLQLKLFLKMMHNKIKHTISNKYQYYNN